MQRGMKGARYTAAAVMLIILMISMAGHFDVRAAVEPTVTAKAALCYVENTGETIFARNEDEKLPPYSITKLMTALVTVMNVPLDKKVKISKAAAEQPGSTAGLIQGEHISVEDLLYGALVNSGNDAAYALSEATSGSSAKFVKEMNRTAKNIGCKNTKFANPSGLKDKNNYTTANDLLLIMKVALENDTIKKIAGTRKYMVKPTDKSKARDYKSNVFGLTGDGNIFAGKNGFVSDTEATTAFGYRKEGLTLYVVLLGDTLLGRMNDARAIVKYADDLIQGELAVKAGEKMGSVRIKHGSKTKLDCYTKTDGYAYIPSEGSKELISTKVETRDDITAPVKKGDVVGSCKILVGEEEVSEVPLVIKESVGEGWFTSYLGISNSLAVILGIILGAAFILFIILTVMRAHFRHKMKKERRRRAMELAEKEIAEEEDRRNRGWDM